VVRAGRGRRGGEGREASTGRTHVCRLGLTKEGTRSREISLACTDRKTIEASAFAAVRLRSASRSSSVRSQAAWAFVWHHSLSLCAVGMNAYVTHFDETTDASTCSEEVAQLPQGLC
jgi:hypothetical protein